MCSRGIGCDVRSVVGVLFFLTLLIAVFCRKLLASLGREKLVGMNVEASVVQLKKPSSGELLLATHYRELGENRLWTGLHWCQVNTSHLALHFIKLNLIKITASHMF
jgi:hypothetical protein